MPACGGVQYGQSSDSLLAVHVKVEAVDVRAAVLQSPGSVAKSTMARSSDALNSLLPTRSSPDIAFVVSE
jgi:hypothetical protein